MGTDAADWSNRHLGGGNRFATDRTNRLLLATRGRQRLVTTLLHRIDVSGTLFSPTLSPSELYDIRAGQIDYLLIDMRLTTDLPLLGVYFEKGEPPNLSRRPNLGYERLLPALNRLRGVVINTTIATGKRATTHGFGLIDEFTYNRRGSMHAKRLEYLEIKLSDWLFCAITAIEVLPISRDYFRLRSSLDRRIYELARKHCGRQPSWRIGFDTLQKKCGSRQVAKHFSAHLRGMVRSNHLPDYALTLESGQAVFFKRVLDAEALPKTVGVSVVSPPTVTAQVSAPVKPVIRVSQNAMDALYDVAPGYAATGSRAPTWAGQLTRSRRVTRMRGSWAGRRVSPRDGGRDPAACRRKCRSGSPVVPLAANFTIGAPTKRHATSSRRPKSEHGCLPPDRRDVPPSCRQSVHTVLRRD